MTGVQRRGASLLFDEDPGAYGDDVHVRVLGPVAVLRDGVDLPLGGRKQRTVLALLAAGADGVVSVDALIDGLWGEEPTPGARSTLHTYISNLRHELGEVIVREGGGYRLVVEPERVDAVEFEQEVARAGALVESDPASASQRIRAALALWRGHPYADVTGSFRLEVEARRLGELRLGAVEARIEAELVLGHHADLVAELDVLCAEFPLREGFRAQHMLALYRAGRQAEALRAFQKTRTYLTEELGLDPSTHLRQLEHRILNQDASLALETQPQVETVAFLLTDIEDSTVLWEMRTEAMRSAVERHDAIVFAAVEAAGGRVVKRVGDGIDTVFAGVGAAVSAAQEIQRGLAGLDWDETGPLLVRTAIDVGEVEGRAGDYFGPVLNRAGRLLAAAHGGQVLLSADAHAALAAGESGWQAKALGEYRFKGIGTPQTVFQLLLDGLPAEFPPLQIDRLPPQAPTAFGRSVRGYELREQVGSGDFGIVYRAYQPSVGREVAIKIIRPELVNRPAFVRRFEAEAQLVARLEDPYVVALYDYWREPDGAYLVMRWLRGGSLRTALERGPWNVEPALRLLGQVGGALSHAHRQGVVHGDLKPANVLLDEEGNAYLSDFGIAARLADPSDPGRGVTSSPAYVAPERLEGEPLGPPSDLYALGLLSFELLSGRRPPMDGRLPSLHRVRPELPEALDGVIAKATATHPADRHQSVYAFLAAVTGVLGGASPSAAETFTVTENPYKGLRAFDETDAGDFFGRGPLVSELVAAVREHRLVAVVGPSGIGKSSVVKAGLIPALRGGALPGSETWVVTDMLPGSYPFDELSASLLRVAVARPDELVEDLARDELGMRRVIRRVLPPDSELLLVVDQFEELFTHTSEEETRRRFLAGLTQLVADSGSRARVVLTLRADFLDQPLSYPEFGALLKAGMRAVTVPSEDDLATAIERPAAGAGVHFEPGLVSRIVADVQNQPGALPLLQYALTELFAARTSDLLTLEGYGATGGVVGALGHRAEELYESLDRSGQIAARQIFLRLVTVDARAQDTRRRVQRRELLRLELDPAPLDEILGRYGEHRLLTFDREPLTRSPTVEVAHEALLDRWARLRSWVDERREDMLLRRRLLEAVAEWEESGRDPDYLPREARLVQIESRVGTSDLALTTTERDFLAEGRRQDDDRRRRTARRRSGILAGFAVAAAVSVLLAVLALVSRGQAVDEARTAQAQELGARALTESRLDRALLLARQGEALDPSLETYGNLLAAQLRAPAAVAVVRPWERTTLAPSPGLGVETISRREACVAVSADGKTLAAGDLVNGLVLLDAHTFRGERQIGVVFPTCRDLAFSPDGSTFATVGWRAQLGAGDAFVANDERLQLVLVDVDSATVRGVPLSAGSAPTGALAYSPDGRSLITIENREHARPGSSGTSFELVGVHREAETGWPVGREVRLGLSESRPARAWARYLPDGNEVVVSMPSGSYDAPEPPGRTLVLDAQSRRPVRSFEVGSHIAALSPDGGTVALGRLPRADQVTLLDLRSGSRRTLSGRHEGTVQGVGFSPDGTTLVTTGADGTAIVWDVATREVRERVDAHTGPAFGPAFTPDGRTVFTAGLDEPVIAWDMAGDRRLGRPFRWAPAGEPERGAEFVGTALSPDGTVLFRGSPDGRVLAVSVPDGRTLWETTVWSQARISRFQTEQARALKQPLDQVAFGVNGWVQSLALNPDGTRLAVAAHHGEVALLDAAGGKVVRRWRASAASLAGGNRGTQWVNTVAFTADGRFVVTGSDEGRAVIWEASSGREIAAVTLPSDSPRYVLAAVPSPDRRELALFTGPNITAPSYRPPGVSRVGVWNVETGEPRWERDIGPNFWARPVLAASPDWSLLATAGFLREVRLWNANTGNQVGNPIPASEGFVVSAAFDRTGERLLTGGTDGTARVFDVASHRQIGTSLPGVSDKWTTALFGTEGTSVLALSGAGRAWLWDLSTERLRAQACRVAHRVLTEDEWQRFVPGRRYAPACRG